MTKKKFKRLWESNEEGGGITYNDIADCAKEWGLYHAPKINPIDEVVQRVLSEAGCSDDADDKDEEGSKL